MDDNLKQEIKQNLKSSIRKFFQGKEVKTIHVLDNIFPVERRIRSLIGGLEGSLGKTLWEPLSKTLAQNNDFILLNKKLVKPKKFPSKVLDEIISLKELRESKDNSISMEECIKRLREAALKSDRNDLEFGEAPSGNGVDVYLKKDNKEYVFDIKTNQVNQGKGKALNLQLLEWYAYRFCEDPDAQFEARIAFPFNPYKNKTWWQGNGARAYPLEQGKDAWVEDEFWDFCSGEDNTWNKILQIFVELGDENFGQEFEDIFYQKTKFNVIELFSGCGGMALGFENAGLKTQLLVEIDKNCVNTLEKNRPDWKVEHQDIAQVDFTKYKGKIDIVAGGPPCQAFSYAGHSRGFEDTRGTLFFELARCVKEVQPKIALVENVRGLIRHDEGRTLSTMLQALEDLGYKPIYRLLRAQFLDVPQKRERLVIIGVRKDLDISTLFPKEKDYTVSVREALKDCPPSDGATYPKRKGEILKLVPPGGCWRDLPIDIQKEYMMKSFYLGGGKTGMARRLSWDEPSLTLTCSPTQKQTERCHPEETRPLTVREYARIQSFPDDWQFTGSTASQYRQIGNAVPVNLAYHIGKCLIAMLERKIDSENMMIEKTEKAEKIQLSLPL